MARGFGRSALRAALGGIAGGLEGLGAMRAAQRLEQEQARAAEAATRAEQRAALSARGMVAPPDMPGATPRPGYTRQRIGEMEFLFEPEFAKDMRTAGHEREAKAFEARTKAAERAARIDTAVRAAERAGMDPNKVRALMEADPAIQSVMASRMFPAPVRTEERRLSPGQEQAIRDEEAEAEALFNTTMAGSTEAGSSPLRQALASSFNALRRTRPTARPQELMRAAVQAAQGARIPMWRPAPRASQQDQLDADMERLNIPVPASAQARLKRTSAPPARQPAPAALPGGMTEQDLQRRAQEARNEGYSEKEIAAYLSALRNPNY